MFAALAACGLFVFRYFGLTVLHALVGHAFDASAPLLVTYGLAMVLLALTNALTSYGIATHRLAFTVPLLISTLGTLAAIVVVHPTPRDGRRDIGRRQRRRRGRGRRLADRAAAHDGPPFDRVKRVLLIGGSGQLGTEILQALASTARSRRRRIGSSTSQTARAFAPRSSAFVPTPWSTAPRLHDVDRCESEPERAFEINALAVAASRCARARVRRGLRDDQHRLRLRRRRRRAVRGERRAASAFRLRRLEARRRTAWWNGCDSRALRGAHVRALRRRGLARPGRRSSNACWRIRADAEPMRVVADVVASPTFAGHLADALRRLIETESYGLYHAVNAGAVSWYDFASRSGTAGAG